MSAADTDANYIDDLRKILGLGFNELQERIQSNSIVDQTIGEDLADNIQVLFNHLKLAGLTDPKSLAYLLQLACYEELKLKNKGGNE